MVRIIETPRDAFQGIAHFIPTAKKIAYINALLGAGFDTVEVGSFVSPKAIPQMSDTAEVIKGLDLSATSSRIMVLAANLKGVETAVQYDEVNDISYPFSASPSFLKKNIGKSQIDSLLEIEQCSTLCDTHNKRLIVYLTMAFGNPYGDEWSIDTVVHWAESLGLMGLSCIPLSDITGEADEQRIREVYTVLIDAFPAIEFGLHLHAEKSSARAKLAAAYGAGCRRYDTVLGGIGGCPMTGFELLANLDTQTMVDFLTSQHIDAGLHLPELQTL
jgi:hydroxymethylglutaryl-CoA lyase